MSSESEWRCTVCNKVKELRGAHLNGKSTVRTDCWPCAKKQTFNLVSASAAGAAVKKDAPQFLFSQQPAAAAATAAPTPAAPTFVSAFASTSASTPFVSAFSAKPTATPAAAQASPFATKPPASAAPSPFGQFGGGKTGNPFVTASSTTKGGSPPNPFGQTSSGPFTAAAAPSSQIVMQNNAPTPGKGKPMPSPPFAFVSKPPLGAPPTFSLSPGGAATTATTAPSSTTTTTMSADDQWKCNVCNKNKELRGAHLNGKSSVRTDCWPCAKKQTFQRYSPTGEMIAPASTKPNAPVEASVEAPAPSKNVAAASPFVSPFASASSSVKSSSQAPQSAKSLQTPLEPFSTTETVRTSSSFTMTPVAAYQHMRPSAFTWREPEVPSYDAERQFFVQSVACAAGIAPCSSSSAGGEISLSSIFFEKTIQTYLANIRGNVFAKELPMVWASTRDAVFVTCSNFLTKITAPVSSPSAVLYSGLGDVASVLMHLDATIGAGSERIGRVFCADTVTLAAAALYSLHINRDIVAFGPAPDKTIKPTLLDDIVEILPCVQTRVTSGEQRNAASKQLWQTLSISVMPHAAQGDAIRRNEPGGKPKAGTIDVVLITKSTTADEASQFRLLIA